MDPRLTKDEKKQLRQEEARDRENRDRKNRLYKILAVWILGALLFAGAIWALIAFSNGSTTSVSSTLTAPAASSSDYQSNPSGAKVTLTEYADFQCPACKAYYPVVKQLQSTYGNKLNFVYRYFPLKTVHQNAINSAKAAYAAGKQNKFWEMHDKLFENQDTWATIGDPESIFVGYAKDLGLKVDQFKKDYASSTTEGFINTTYNNDTAMGLNSTPTFFVNNKQIVSPQSLDEFKKLLDDAIAGK